MFKVKIIGKSSTKKSYVCQVWRELEDGILVKAGFGFIQVEGAKVKDGTVLTVEHVTFRNSGLPLAEGQAEPINEVLVA